MTLLSRTTINTREDLEALRNTQAYHDFMAALKGTMVRRQNVQVYPEDYGQASYTGPELEPIWEEVEDLSTIQRFGFTKADFS